MRSMLSANCSAVRFLLALVKALTAQFSFFHVPVVGGMFAVIVSGLLLFSDVCL